MAERSDNDTDWYFVKVKLEASYVLTVPANSEEEATRREAYRADVPAGKLYDVEKAVVSCSPSCNEIIRRAEERPAFRRRGATRSSRGMNGRWLVRSCTLE